VLFARVALQLGLEAGFVGAALVGQGGAAVHLLQQPGLVEQFEVAAHGHVAHTQQPGEIADAHGTAPTHFGQDDLMTLAGECPRRPEIGGRGG